MQFLKYQRYKNKTYTSLFVGSNHCFVQRFRFVSTLGKSLCLIKDWPKIRFCSHYFKIWKDINLKFRPQVDEWAMLLLPKVPYWDSKKYILKLKYFKNFEKYGTETYTIFTLTSDLPWCKVVYFSLLWVRFYIKSNYFFKKTRYFKK